MSFLNTEDPTEYLKHWSTQYKTELQDDILPFWIKHGLDKQNGGVYTCLNRDGSLMDTDKSVWFQGRAGWIFAAAYNQIEKKPEYLEAARSCVDFIEKHCFDKDGRMFYQVSEKGVPIRKRRYVFSETFAAIAFAEYATASGDGKYAQKALELFKFLVNLLQTPGELEPKFRPEAGKSRGHSVCMIMLNTGYCIREAIKDEFITKQIDNSLADLKKYFMKEDLKCVLECVGENGEFINSNGGRCINPGHSIETAWFVLEEAKYRGGDKNLTEMGIKIFDWSWEWGWDKEHGGIIYFRDCLNKPQQEYWQDMKFWWPQNEAVIATLYCYQATKDPKYLELHKKINDWAFSKLQDKQYGEWYGYLHKDGTVAQPAKGNLYKGPFHIPRMMLKSHLLCEEILKSQNK